MAGSSTTNTTTEQSSAPPQFQEDELRRIFAEARNLYENGPALKGPVGFTPEEKAAQQGALNYATGDAMDVASRAREGLGFALNGALDPSSNPYLAASAEGAIRPVQESLTRSVLPELRGSAIDAGALGSSRQGIAEGLAVSDFTRQAADTTSKMYSDAYNRGLQTFETGLGLAPSVMELGAKPFEIQSGVGAQQRAMTQGKQDFAQYEPYMRLAQYLSFVGGNYGGEGTATTTQPSTLWERIFGQPLM